MACSHPSYAIRLGAINKDTGKEKIKFLPTRVDFNYSYLCDRYGKENVILIPCGKCSNCIEKRSKEWALRCSFEASCYKDNCFLTLTYNDNCLPKYGLCKRDLQKFIKRLRKKYGSGLRYFACGEYGTLTKRPHYHLIVFNLFPDDAKFSAPSKFGGNYYTSKEIQKLWSFGFVSVGEVSFSSCAYVSRYCMKKLKEDHKCKEFLLMSTKPAIGYDYFIKNFDNIVEVDKMYFQGSSYKPVRFFDKLFERIDPVKFEAVKSFRLSSAASFTSYLLLSGCFHSIEEMYSLIGKDKDNKFLRLERKGV